MFDHNKSSLHEACGLEISRLIEIEEALRTKAEIKLKDKSFSYSLLVEILTEVGEELSLTGIEFAYAGVGIGLKAGGVESSFLDSENSPLVRIKS